MPSPSLYRDRHGKSLSRRGFLRHLTTMPALLGLFACRDRAPLGLGRFEDGLASRLIARFGRPRASEPKVRSPLLDLVQGEIDLWLKFAADQVTHLVRDSDRWGRHRPRSRTSAGTTVMIPLEDPCSGYLAGSLWHLYGATLDPMFRTKAHQLTLPLVRSVMDIPSESLGPIVVSSLIPAFHATGELLYRDAIAAAAARIARQFDPAAGALVTSRDPRGGGILEIEQMISLEVLFEAQKWHSSRQYMNIAASHLATVRAHQIARDGRVIPAVLLEGPHGIPGIPRGSRGYGDHSAWAQGQGWGLLGFVSAYRSTKNPDDLAAFLNIQRFVFEHRNMGSSLIPPWDLEVPLAHSAPQDSAAAAMMGAALTTLAFETEEAMDDLLLLQTRHLLVSLSEPPIRAAHRGDLGGFVLKSGVGWMAQGLDVGQPTVYGDYFYIKALAQLKRELRLRQSTQTASYRPETTL